MDTRATSLIWALKRGSHYLFTSFFTTRTSQQPPCSCIDPTLVHLLGPLPIPFPQTAPLFSHTSTLHGKIHISLSQFKHMPQAKRCYLGEEITCYRWSNHFGATVDGKVVGGWTGSYYLFQLASFIPWRQYSSQPLSLLYVTLKIIPCVLLCWSTVGC